ncbi:hypothetical protein ADL26_16070 [Thermoactinomyces vulgaris]|jgi:ribosomal protein S18 acetylase RimI-like enzyme|nr:hypothetical protein ADL26_16070 [Thermoactinomyces vulgaris]
MDHRRLQPNELDELLTKIDKESNLLYFTYLTVRRQQTVHYGQFSSDARLLGVLAYLYGLPFHAFSYALFSEEVCIRPLLTYLKEDLDLPDGDVGSTFVPEKDVPIFTSQLGCNSPQKVLNLMKHIDLARLAPVDHRVVRIEPHHFGLVKSRMKEIDAIAFTEEELNNLPFYGVFDNDELVAVGGYHLFDSVYVELGNIGTTVSRRRQGWGRIITTELTRRAREYSSDVYLYVFDDNVPAIRLYESLGYRLISKLQRMEFSL